MLTIMEQNDANSKVVPLELMMRTAKVIVNNALNTLINDIGLPYYLVDGIFSEVMSEIRNKEILNFSKAAAEKEGD